MKILQFLFLAALAIPSTEISASNGYRQIPGVIQVHTNFDGSGEHSLEQLVDMAKARGVEFLIPTDHDLQVMEYGVFPLRNIVKRREQRDSVIKLGPDKYLDEIRAANQQQKDVLIIPGVQSSPFYYWTGSPFGTGLTAHEYRKEMLLIGMDKPEDYLDLPLMHRGFSMRYFEKLLPRSILFVLAFLFSIYLIFQKRSVRTLGMGLSAISLLLIVNHHPFQSSLFNPYSGNQGVKPFQELIDYVNERGGLTFWSHPESNYALAGVRLGPVTLKTGHYINDLFQAKDYTGFEAIYGDTITATEPGRHWDKLLIEYCSGKRDKPVWGIAGADFHESKPNQVIDEFQTVVFAPEKTTPEILKALSTGRCYVFRKIRNPKMVLDTFQVVDKTETKKAISGEELSVNGRAYVEASISSGDKGSHEVTISLIRSGKVIEEFRGETPVHIQYADPEEWTGKQYYRLEVKAGGGRGKLLSNPIFVVKG